MEVGCSRLNCLFPELPVFERNLLSWDILWDIQEYLEPPSPNLEAARSDSIFTLRQAGYLDSSECHSSICRYSNTPLKYPKAALHMNLGKFLEGTEVGGH